MKLVVELNGTDSNPYHKLGLSQNPFPQLGRDHGAACLQLQALGGDQIPDTDYIRNKLRGYFNDDFIELCCQKFKPGEMVTFEAHWD